MLTYSQITDYWNKNPCSGGNEKFPFWFWKKKRVLEIGFGTGVDSNRFLKAGALYTGVDLTGIKDSKIFRKMNAEELDFPDEHFDLVYSFGVIHHALNPEKILKEVKRVMKPNGIFFLMLYGKPSVRFNLDIMFFRRILWFFRYHRYRELRKQYPHPTPEQWLSWNTDTLGCPLARAYTEKETRELLKDFTITNTWTEHNGWFRMICVKK